MAIVFAVLTFVLNTALLIVCSIFGWAQWRHRSPYWATPALVCGTCLLLAGWFMPAAGRSLADFFFTRRLPEYQREVDSIRNDENFAAARGRFVLERTNAVPRGVRAVRAAQCKNGTFVVEFLLDTHVILLHDGYRYQTGSEDEPCLIGAGNVKLTWPYLRHVRDHWYHFSDQPGL
jgi:hypothetical protein